MKKIAVISDLHVGDNTRFHEFGVNPAKDKALKTRFVDSFSEFIKKEKISADILVVAGDISESARPSEIKTAIKMIEFIRDKLEVEPNNVFLVPGNHDLDRSAMKLGHEAHDDDKKYYDSLGFGTYKHSETHDQKGWFDPSLCEEPFYKIWKTKDFLFLGYNSAWNDGPKKNPHHGHAGEVHLEKIEDEIQKLGDIKDLYKIAVVHHHFLPFSDPIPDFIDLSQMTNAENFMNLLVQNKFDFAIHGHKHIPRFRAYSDEAGWPLPILCAGSLSAVLHNELAGLATNQFHLIELEGREKDEDSVFGYLRNWAFINSKGWIPSGTTCGIESKLPFGSFLRQGELKNLIRHAITSISPDSNDWKKLVDLEPKLKFVSHKLLNPVVESLGKEPSFEILGGDGNILVRRKGGA